MQGQQADRDRRRPLEPPLFANGKVYVGSLDGNLYAIDPTSGKEDVALRRRQGIVTQA